MRVSTYGETCVLYTPVRTTTTTTQTPPHTQPPRTQPPQPPNTKHQTPNTKHHHNQQPTTNNQQPTTNHQPPTTNHRPSHHHTTTPPHHHQRQHHQHHQQHHHLPVEGRNRTSRRVRRRRISGNDISFPLQRTECVVVWRRLWRFLWHWVLHSALTHKSCSCSRGQRGEQAASPLVCVCCAWLSSLRISPIRTWRSRMLPTTPCGRCFAIICGAVRSTSWWLEHPHPPSHLL